MTNEALYTAALAGNQDAFTQLMERLGDPLTFYIYGYTRNFEDAEDLMIAAFSYLIVKKPKIQEGGLKAYLYKAGRNMALRSVQKKNRCFSIDLEHVQEISDEKALIDNVADTREKNNVLHQCIEMLALDYQEAIYLVYFEGMSHKQAAQIMGKREKQVSDLIYRGKKSLKPKLEQEGINHA